MHIVIHSAPAFQANSYLFFRDSIAEVEFGDLSSWYSWEVTITLGRSIAKQGCNLLYLNCSPWASKNPKEFSGEESGDLTHLFRWHAPLERNYQVF